MFGVSQMRTGQAGTGKPRAGAPPESAIPLAVDMVAVCEGAGAHLALRDDLEVDVMIGAKGLQDGIETLPRPPQELAQPMDGNAVVVGVEALVGGLKLSPEGVGLDESGTLLLVIKPGAQGLADGGVARRVAPSSGGTPVHITPFGRALQRQSLDQGPARCPLASYVPRLITSPSS